MLNSKVFPLLLLAICLGCGATSSSTAPSSSTPPTLKLFANAQLPLVTPTYDGSGQAMHPDIVQFANVWHGYKYWMSVTPYPGNNATVENPSILASNDGQHWEVPPGLVNPIAPLPSGVIHQMDSDMIYDTASDQLWAYYLTPGVNDGKINVSLRNSSDGVNWAAAKTVVSSAYNSILSPAVQHTPNGYFMWSVNAAPLGCSAPQTTVELRTSSDGLTWSQPVPVNLSQPGYQPWHIDVVYVPPRSEYWAIYAAYPTSVASCGTTSLYFARSSDGSKWTTYARPVLSPSQAWDAGQIYRSTLIYDSSTDTIHLWYSARDASTHTWHTGYTESTYANLIAALTQ